MRCIMLFAEWTGKRVTVYNEYKTLQRVITVTDTVVSVQCTGDKADADARIAITMANGKTRLYNGHATLIR